ncbi:MAG: hypothetical protein IJ523_05530 [Succinivibrionaceae bacterium]|nr:hypothetical protein [Succinivibrionaceae bacterium]
MLTDEQIEQFIQNAERELEQADRAISQVSESLKNSEFEDNDEVRKAANDRLKDMELSVAQEAVARVDSARDSIRSSGSGSVRATRRRGLMI